MYTMHTSHMRPRLGHANFRPLTQASWQTGPISVGSPGRSLIAGAMANILLLMMLGSACTDGPSGDVPDSDMRTDSRLDASPSDVRLDGDIPDRRTPDGSPGCSGDCAACDPESGVCICEEGTHPCNHGESCCPWAVQGVADFYANYGFWLSMALDSAGRPHIVSDEQDVWLHYYVFDGSACSHEMIAEGEWAHSIDETVGPYATIAMDGADAPHVAYLAGIELMYAHRDGGDWVSESVDSASVDLDTSFIFDMKAYLGLAVGPQGKVHIVYRNRNADSLRYAHQTQTGWETEEADTSPDVGWFASLALDQAGNVHVAHYDGTNHDLRYACRRNGTWAVEVVDTEGDVGRYASIAVTDAGVPYIAYYDQTNGNLKVAHRIGSTWAVEAVDTALYVGKGASLALDSRGHPHVAYYDMSSSSLKYAYFSGSAWQVQTVDNDGDAGYFASLDLDDDDAPHIAYRGGGATVRYAR